MKLMLKYKRLELFGLFVGLAATITLTGFLITGHNKCIIPFEPTAWIRIPEIIMGIIAIFILIRIIFSRNRF